MRLGKLSRLGAFLVVAGGLGFGCAEEDASLFITPPMGPAAPGPELGAGVQMDAGAPRAGELDATAAADAQVALVDGGADAGAPRVTIADGVLVGSVHGKAQQFLGIPYAKPPVGALRWKRPEKNEPWQGPRDATKFGSRCAQAQSTLFARSEAEDCLFVNVWTPDTAPREKLPVMFWLHGGGNTTGSASEPLPRTTEGVYYSGHKLVEKGVVVVSINYRLGVFGFFAHPALADEADAVLGNQGLFDQALALAWVRDNIAHFGGDPEKVTIFGESAGSLDTCFHVASPTSRGLFRGAISESGGCTTRTASLEQGHASTGQLAAALECGEGADGLACLRAQPVAALLTPPVVTGVTPPTFDPVVDGEFLPDQPRALYDAGEIARVPYLLGSNTDEGTLYVPETPAIPDEATLRARLVARYGSEAYADAILEVYPFARFEREPDPGRAALARIIGDANLVCSTYDTAVRAATAGVPVWMYNFDISNEDPDQPATKGLGASHGAELVYVFGTQPKFDAQKRAVSDMMQDYWTHFAKGGDPNGGTRPSWPAFAPEADVRLNFALEDTTQRSDFRASECAFWRARYALRFSL